MRKVCFLLNAVSISGGAYVVFQHAAYLQKHGLNITIAVQSKFIENTFKWHPDAKFLNIKNLEDAVKDDYELVIATFWSTVFDLPKFKATRFAYFVQSIESRFYETSNAMHYQALQTYKLPLYFIAIADWIGDFLINLGAKNIWIVKNGIRKDLYHSLPEDKICASKMHGLRVLVEGPFGVSYKNTALSIKVAKSLGVSEIWVLTSTPVTSIPGVSRVFSQVPIEDTPTIYRSCDVLLKLSTVEGLFGPPLEMFHCGGTAVVMEVSGHDEYIVDKENAIVIRREFFDKDINQLKMALHDPQFLEKLKKGATKTAALWPSWDRASSQMMDAIDQVLKSPDNRKLLLSEISKINNNQDMRIQKKVVRGLVLRVKSALPLSIINMLRTIKIYFEILAVPMKPK